MMYLLAGALVLGCLALIASAEEGKLEDAAYKAEINRLADKSRGDWGKKRRHRKYMKAGARL